VLLFSANADRDHRPQLEAVGVVAAGAQVVTQGAGDDREHDVVDRAAVGVLDRFQVAELGADEGEPAVRPDIDVEAAVGGGGRRLEEFPGGAEAAQHPARSAQHGAHAAHDLARAGRPLAQRVGEQVEVGWLRAGRPLRRPQRRLDRVLLEVEEDGRDVYPGDPVDERVVTLADHGEAVALDALDQPHLPERLGPVELLGEDPRCEVAQLLIGAGRRQRRAAHVVVEVEERVVDPYRAALSEGDRAQLLAKARHQVQARLEVVAELLVRGSRALEVADRGDVHVSARPLHVKKGGVESAQPVAVHGPIFA